MDTPVEIFFSYAHEDEALMDDVRRQLIVYERNGRILKWHDRQIPPGSDWRIQIDERINMAQIILLFMSPHFIESHYCYEIEGETALRRHASKEAEVIPIILRPCAWEATPFGTFQALPRDAVPITRWPDRDEVCLNVARGVMSVVDKVIEGRNLK
jgi:TIR domain